MSKWGKAKEKNQETRIKKKEVEGYKGIRV
jgi:hypothetical protein